MIDGVIAGELLAAWFLTFLQGAAKEVGDGFCFVDMARRQSHPVNVRGGWRPQRSHPPRPAVRSVGELPDGGAQVGGHPGQLVDRRAGLGQR
ncbi:MULTISPECIES: hypothetical protein, partial [unclassified Blastococcus]|uniref:hypothetical protein n=1 Tax=unclassified Blastococcus TaxID=2619396 RepID=UPI001EEFD5B5